MRYLLALLVVCLAAGAQAGEPAVSALNGKVSVESGVTSSFGRAAAVGTAQGALTAPVGDSFGLEVDAIGSTSRNAFSGGGLAQFFWRDPALGQAGPFGALAGSNGNRIALGGGEAQLFAPNLTVQAFAGYLDVATAAALPAGAASYGAFYGSHLTLYPDPDLALTIGAQLAINRATGTASVEFLPDLTPHRNMSLFVDASAGDDQEYRVTGGIRLYLGPDKSLIRRHREDDLTYGELEYLAWLASIY